MRDIARPHETLLVADSLTGQDAVKLARSFDERVGITGIVLTRVDGDGRGGAALSMRAVTGKPIKLIGVGEKWDALEDFHPQRIAGRILGMGDVVSLVEKAAQTLDMEKAQAIAQKMRKGSFDLEDLSDQLKQMEKIGGMSGMMGMLPGIGKVKKQLDAANLDDKVLKRQRAIISSMTPKERRNPKILDGKRKRRIAAGSGTKPEDVNKLIKMHRQMADMMKTMGKRGGIMQRMMGMGGGAPSEAEMERMRGRARPARPQGAGGAAQGPQGAAAQGAAAAGRRRRPSAAEAAGPARAGRPVAAEVPGAAGIAGEEEVTCCPVLETERLRLRGWREEDLPAVRRLLGRRGHGALRRRHLQPRATPGGAWPCTSGTGRCAATACGRWRRRRAGAGRLLRALEPRGLAGARDRLGPGEGLPRPRLCDGGRAARPRLRLSRARLADGRQLHRRRERSLRSAWRSASVPRFERTSSCGASLSASTAIPVPMHRASNRTS